MVTLDWTSDWTRGKKDSAVEVLQDIVRDRSFGLDPSFVAEICSTYSTTTEKCILLEYAQFSRILPPDGMYIIPVRDCVYRWDGVYFIPQGPLESRLVRFVIKIPENYPKEMPVINCNEFVPFHPLLDEMSGKLDTSPAFLQWNSDGWINDILSYFEQAIILQECSIDWISVYLSSESGLNEAGKLLLQSKDLYLIRAKRCVTHSNNYIYDEPDSTIKFLIV